MKRFNVMIKPASSLCNMRCKYCFYADVSKARDVFSYGIMTEDTMLSVLKNIKASVNRGDSVSFAFQGGEPTLAGLEFFESFTSAVSKWEGITATYALQTNGLYLDEKWCEFLKKHKFLVGISFDILPEAHNSTRVDERGEGTYSRVLSSVELMKKHAVDFNVLCTLTGSIARHPEKVWNTLVRLGVEYVQFTPCLGGIDGERSAYALTPERFAGFYTKIFPLWYNAYRQGSYRSIKLFDDIVNQIILGYPTRCGMDGKCRPQLVVEADGSVYPCDFYCLDEYRLGNLTEKSIDEMLLSENVIKFLGCQSDGKGLCAECQYAKFCGGNCRRMRKEICTGKAQDYCGYREFLDNCGEKLVLLAREVTSNKIKNKEL